MRTEQTFRVALLLAIAGIVVVGAVGALRAQAPAAGTILPAFDVASVKPNTSSAPASSRFPMGPGDAYVSGTLFSATNQALIVYLRFAYKLGQGGLLRLPGWVYNDRFDIEARAQGNPTKDQMRLMVQSLLADRFNLMTHTEKADEGRVQSRAGEGGQNRAAASSAFRE